VTPPSNPHAALAGRAATVMGLGLFGGGAGAVRYLAGRRARVTVTDLREAGDLAESLREIDGLGARLVLGRHREEDFTGADLVVASPAVPPSSPFLQAARRAGVPVRSEAGLFLEACPARLAAITGTQGKSSTCRFLAQLLAACGVRVHLGGNIGGSLLGELDAMAPADVAVMELSSYQLEALAAESELAPHRAAELAAVTNVLRDHLDRHGSEEAYARAKARVLDLLAPDGAALLPADDPRSAEWGRRARRCLLFGEGSGSGADLVLEGGRFLLSGEDLGAAADLRAPGAFQRRNALVALGAARILGAPGGELAAAIARLDAPAHRLQDLGRVSGHRVWDNGVSTTPDSTLAAVQSLEGSLILLCGGRDKGLGWGAVAAELSRRGARVVTFGEAAGSIAEAMSEAGVEVRAEAALERAVAVALERLEGGEALLFSPGCASFDAWRNFAERAAAFRAALPAGDPVPSLRGPEDPPP